MKIYLYYESNFKKDYIWLDVPEEEMTITIERDYQKRLAKEKPGEKVVRRDFQTIMNEEISKPTYNSNHKDERRRASYDKLDAHETLLCDSNISRKTTTANGKRYSWMMNRWRLAVDFGPNRPRGGRSFRFRGLSEK